MRTGFSTLALAAGLLIAFTGQGSAAATPTVVFATGFERAEGFTNDLPLVGQKGWVAFGTGGNGIVTNFFDSLGTQAGIQQAYIGFNRPESTNDFFSLLRPLDYSPIANAKPLVKFSVLMAITASTTTNRDDFRWSVYNMDAKRLFTVDFDTTLFQVSYVLEDGQAFFSTGVSFTNDVIYELALTMNFAQNRWSAALDTQELIQALPITTTNSVLTLGDIDAVWAIRNPGSAGDNYMVFDNYLVTAEPVPVPRLSGKAPPNVGFLLQLTEGTPGHQYVIDISADLKSWLPAKTNTAGDGTFDWLDTSASGADRRFYRAREAP
jgi:hypothetical protein